MYCFRLHPYIYFVASIRNVFDCMCVTQTTTKKTKQFAGVFFFISLLELCTVHDSRHHFFPLFFSFCFADSQCMIFTIWCVRYAREPPYVSIPFRPEQPSNPFVHMYNLSRVCQNKVSEGDAYCMYVDMTSYLQIKKLFILSSFDDIFYFFIFIFVVFFFSSCCFCFDVFGCFALTGTTKKSPQGVRQLRRRGG